MEIQQAVFNESQNVACLTFVGRLDARSREAVKTYLHEVLVGPSTFLILDLSQVPFIDSSGLSALVSGLRVARESRKELLLVGLSKQAQMVFDLTMMDRVFSIFPSQELALESIGSS